MAAAARKTSPRNRHPAPADSGAKEIKAYLEAVGGSKGAHAYVHLLGMRTSDPSGLHEKVQAGLSFAAFRKLAEIMKLSMQAAADVLLITSRTLHRRQLSGRLEPDESDRLVRLSRVYGKAIELFEGDNGAASRWLRSSVTGLDGATPLEMSRTEPGAMEVERLIGRLEHGVFA